MKGMARLVFLIVFDPVDLGLVTNLARPGGNVTGVTGLANLEIFAKRLQFVKEIVPSLERVAILLSTERTRSTQANEALKAAAGTLGVTLVDVEVQSPSELQTAIQSAKNRGAQALYVWPKRVYFLICKTDFGCCQRQSLAIDLLRQGRRVEWRPAGLWRRSQGRGTTWCCIRGQDFARHGAG